MQDWKKELMDFNVDVNGKTMSDSITVRCTFSFALYLYHSI